MNFRPLNDMILVKPDLMDEKIGSIYIPQGALKAGDQPGDYEDSFIGTVVATGPGDQTATLRCTSCGRERTILVVKSLKRRSAPAAHPDESEDGEQVAPSGGPGYRAISVRSCRCGKSETTFVRQGHAPMQTKVGDRVIFPRRPNSPGGEYSLVLDGEKYIMMHEEQFAFGILGAA